MLVRKAKQNPHMTAKGLQEGPADTGLALHHSTLQHYSHKHDLDGRVIRTKPYLRALHKSQCLKYTKHTWKKVLWTDKVAIELGMITEAAFDERNTLSLVAW